MFSYTEYINFIKLVRDNLPLRDFADITEDTEKFCVLRHDIEFSLDRALRFAEIEFAHNISSTYTVQLRNNTYNALSEKNISIVQQIRKLGHKIGLHQTPPDLSLDKIKANVIKDIDVLQHYYQFEIDRFAFHRPNVNPEILGWYIQVNDLINCNGSRYFHYFEGKRPAKLNVTYLADSNHQWRYGHPVSLDFKQVKKLQINTHPFSWTETGYERYGNFLSLIEERKKEMLHDMDSENKAFPKELLL